MFKELNVIMGMHCGTDENGNMILNNDKAFHWRIPNALTGKVNKGDMVIVRVKTKSGAIKHVPVLVIDVINNFENTENLNLKNIVRVLDRK